MTISTRALLTGALLLVLSAAHREAAAQPVGGGADVEQRAADEYDRGATAHARRDFRAATAHFARADEMAANPIALEAALRASILADEAVLGMRLVARAEARRPLSPGIAAAVGEVTERFASRTGRIALDCDACSATVDGEPVAARSELVVATGLHRVALRAGDRVEPEREVVVVPGGIVRLLPRPTSTPAPPPPPPPVAITEGSSEGLHPAVFWIGVGATALLGAATIASGVDVLAREDEFLADPTTARAAAGQSAETRTYVLGGATGLVGLGTIAVGTFAIEW